MSRPSPIRTLTEVVRPDDGVPRAELAEWSDPDEFPGVVCGLTLKGNDFDLAVAGEGPVGPVLERWTALRGVLGARLSVVSRQPHGSLTRFHDLAAEGFLLAGPCDGHLTRDPGVVLAVTVADCVPIFLSVPESGAVGVVHAGWRGVVEGVLTGAIELFYERLGLDAGEIRMHLGPAICGECYEVGPEVHEALSLESREGPAPVDLRSVLVEQARRSGLTADRITRSSHCTLCGDLPLFSHRGGDAGRQVAFIGVGLGGAE